MLGQKALLERDISKRDSLAGKRRDSVFDRNSKVFDPKKVKALEQTMQVMVIDACFIVQQSEMNV